MNKRVEALSRDTEKEEIERPIEYSLTTPIKAYGDEVTVIKMRKPTGADLVRIGNPVTFYPHVEPPKIEHDIAKMVAMIARLSDLPSSSIERMDPTDLLAVAWILSPFFIPAP